MAAVCILVGGTAEYAKAARETVLSVLDHSPFEVFVAHTIPVAAVLPRSRRVHTLPLNVPNRAHRAYRFLQKFEALDGVLERYRGDFVIMLDADAVLTRALSDADLGAALGKRALGMVEQTGIVRSTMGRVEFLEHYRRHSLAFIAPAAVAPELDGFRFYNSGVVLARRAEMARIVAWARQHIAASDRDHQVGEHMIADQDYFQVWVNNLHPQSCAELPWSWNHCELWDDGFPRDGLRVAHFSNFCNGPVQQTAERMAALRRRGLRWPWMPTVAGRWLRGQLPGQLPGSSE